MTTAQPEFAICIANAGYEDLEVWKVYRLLPDPKAAEVSCLRVDVRRNLADLPLRHGDVKSSSQALT